MREVVLFFKAAVRDAAVLIAVEPAVDKDLLPNTPQEAEGGDVGTAESGGYDPFQYFNLSDNYKINQDDLRNRYFEACLQHAKEPDILAKLHKAYKALLDPVQRLEFLCQRMSIELLAVNEALPAEILEIYEELSHLVPQSAPKFLAKLDRLEEKIQLQVQEALDQRNTETLSALRIRLRYLLRFRKEAFQISADIEMRS